jgi:succinylglutamate desuccinylase
MQAITDQIITIDSGQPGPTLAIIAGVHGNERAGVYALQQLLPNLTITRGKVYAAFANPPAIEANVRFITKNLNRCFLPDNQGNDYEDQRARELMSMLDKCDALLDLHMFYDDDGVPFAICEDNVLELAQKLDVDIISTNWTEVEPGGTDGYMFEAGKLGLCVECGPISKAEAYTPLTVKTVHQFLKYFDMTNEPVEYSATPKRLIRAQKAIHKSSDNFVLAPGLHNFDRLEPGQVIATEGDQQFTATANQCIIFPHYNAKLGEEAYIIGEELVPPTS